MAAKPKPPIPLTVLTGFLGAGKTTLLNHLLTQNHGYKCAIIINEFGSISIDNQLVIGADEEIVELKNGCLCCRVRGDLIKSLRDLLLKKKRFDYVLVETTGLADPSPIAHTFFSAELDHQVELDGIVTVIDARHFEKELRDAPEVQAQVAFADVLLLNKTDLVGEPELHQLEHLLRKMNPLAKIHRTHRSQVDPKLLLNIKARAINSDFGQAFEPDHDHGHDHEHSHDHDHDHSHESHGHHSLEVTSFALTEEAPLDLKKLETWIGELIQTTGENLYRSKGVLHVKGIPKRVVFQGVQMMFDSVPERFWKPDEKRQSQMVFIGKNLDEEYLKKGFAACVAE